MAYFDAGDRRPARSCVMCERGGDRLVLLDLLLPDDARSVGMARRSLTSVLRLWGAQDEALERGELLTSEVFTNATKYGGGESIRLLAVRQGELARIEVHDLSPRLPEQRHADDYDESGRGCFLVEALAASTGAYATASGKAVWFELPAWPRDRPTSPDG
jgi:anti-sigma regulatory factor (Ser/Thr protein kinase)